MKSDIFISYSRDDLAEVEPFVKQIEARTGLRCWIDWNGIEGGAKFEKKIVEAIDQVDVVLFFLSDNSMASDYTEMEISYAYNTKKRVVPVMLDGGQLRGWFLFKFGSINFIDCKEPRQVDTLMGNLKTWCGGKPAPVPAPAPTPVKTYQVGDYYDDGLKQGVVFEVDASGRHGKIVSLVQDQLAWCTSSEYKKFRGMRTNTYTKNGELNQHKVKQIYGWRNKYPAFVWCADLGEDWYLPALEELQLLLLDATVLKAVNCTLKLRGCNMCMVGPDGIGVYWSSSEYQYDKSCACVVDLNAGGLQNYGKYRICKVRAVAQF